METEISCLDCRFIHTLQIVDAQNKPVIGQKTFTCRRFPPTPIITPGPNNTVTMGSQFPPVGKGIKCAEFSSVNPDAVTSANADRKLM